MARRTLSNLMSCIKGPALRLAVCAGVMVAPLSFATPMARANSDADHLSTIRQKDKVDLAIDKGLAWLVKQQDQNTGAFRGELPNTFTALSCMALMAAGHFPGRSAYGENLRKGVRYLVEKSKEHNGYFGHEKDGRMYAHGITTLALAEAYGMMEHEADNRRVKLALDRAVAIILEAQVTSKGKHFGGWHYNPGQKSADLSVAVWQALVLRSAQNCQLQVPQQSIDNALKYIRSVYSKRDKAFTYNGSNPSPSMRSAGVVGMLALGANVNKDDLDKIQHSASYLLKYDPRGGGHYWYQSYYLATAANMMDEPFRGTMLRKLENFLLTLQSPSGEFRKHSGRHGGVYSTAFALICLNVRAQYLPIYQE